MMRRFVIIAMAALTMGACGNKEESCSKEQAVREAMGDYLVREIGAHYLQGGKPVVTAFEQTTDGAGFLPSAKRIFGQHYDVYERMHASQDVRDAARKEQLKEYVSRRGLNVSYYQDYGWDAVEL